MKAYAQTTGLSIRDWAEEDRPRERLLEIGKNSLSDAELLAILIRSGNRDSSAVELSKLILKSVDYNLDNLSKLSVSDLLKFKGIGEAKAISIVAALELGRRKKLIKSSSKPRITCSKDVYNYIKLNLEDLPFEEFWIVLLNKSNSILSKHMIGRGGVSQTLADPKLIFNYALTKLASSIILAHNHPSGRVVPSDADIKLTKKIKNAGSYLDIAILDHIIVGDDKYYSFADQGIL